MEQRKTNKKKLVVALALLALIVVASVITTVVLVLAANQQNINSNVTVTYTVTDVSATVTGKYGLKKTEGDVVDTNMTPDSITINPTDTGNLSMAPANAITLNSSQDYVVFEYKFVNNATSNPFTINLTYVDDFDNANSGETEAVEIKDTNIAVGYTSSTSAITAFDSVCTIEEGEATWAENWATSFAQATCTTTTYVYVIVKVVDTNAAATFSGSFNFVLASTAQPQA